MKKIIIALTFVFASILLFAQNGAKEYKDFLVEGMKKYEGVFNVYIKDDNVYLEIPKGYVGREVLFFAQIDKGFDLIAQPVETMGVSRISGVSNSKVTLQQPFYAERLLDDNHQYNKSFNLSNVQYPGKDYKVVAYSPKGGAIIDITDKLLTSDEWFSYRNQYIGGLVNGMSKLLRATNISDGVVFTIQRYHNIESGQITFSNPATTLPVGSAPLEVSFVVRLLPQKSDNIRLADERAKFQAIKFKDYSHNPYTVVEDSLIVRWDISRHLTLYVDTLFPQAYYNSVKKGVEAWNKALSVSGVNKLIQVRKAEKGVPTSSYPALIAYNLRETGIKSVITHHPRTGEVLNCRLNIGHNALREIQEEYFLQCGTADSRLKESYLSKEVEKDLLQYVVMREVGNILGLRYNHYGSSAYSVKQLKDNAFTQKYGYSASVMDKLPFNFLSSKVGIQHTIGEEDILAIYYGYCTVNGAKNVYDDREKVIKMYDRQRATHKNLSDRKIMFADKNDLSDTPSDASAIGVEKLQKLVEDLDKYIYKDNRYGNGVLATMMYRKACKQYGYYIKQMAQAIGSNQSSTIQRKAMESLDKYLFSQTKPLHSSFVEQNMLASNNEYIIPEVSEMFKVLLSKKTVSSLHHQSLTEDGYSLKEFFSDIEKHLFKSFSPTERFSREQLDVQLSFIKTYLVAVEWGKEATFEEFFLRDELQRISSQLAALSSTHADENVRMLYLLLSQRIQKQLK